MMGTKIRDFAPLPNLSLEGLIPKDNFYRRLEATLEFSFVGDLMEIAMLLWVVWVRVPPPVL